MDAVLLGYFPKRRCGPPDPLRARGIEEIASVSLCICGGPAGWDASWTHNAWGFFASPELAWSRVPGDGQAEYCLYAYGLVPVEYLRGRDEPMALDAPQVTALGPEYELVGYDVVSRSGGSYFECSPLSCNMLAEEMDTNRYCLLPDRGDARALALSADESGCEPGPYHVLQVWRRRQAR